MTADEAFFTVHSGLPREGPGTPEDVAWAVRLARVPRGARMLDAGCGPGGDIAALLAEVPGSRILAVDTHPPFVDAVRSRFPSGRVTALAGDMAGVEGPFDFIWCAGAIYFLGLDEGLAVFQEKLAPGGAIAFSEPCLFKETPTEAARGFWEGYPVRDRCAILAAVDGAGFDPLGDRRVTDAGWEAYHEPLLKRIAALRPGASGALAEALDLNEAEAHAWRAVRRDTGYLLVVARRR